MGGRMWSAVGAMALVCGCGGEGSGEPVPEWSKSPEPAAAVGERRGLTPLRSIVHLHSPYSHDACDGRPRLDGTGAIDEDCLSDLRAALCDARIDVAALTDHDDSMAEEDWGAALFLHREGDELVTVEGEPVGNWIACEDGHRTLIRIGSENQLMPVFMEGHPHAEVGERKAIYNGTSTEAASALRAAGATLWVAHTEQRELGWLRDVGVDGFELFNIHAAIAPDIRTEHLGLDGPAAVAEALEFNVPSEDMPEPDLAGLPLMFENEPAERKWTALLSEGRRITVTAGTDAHQNALPIEMSDGERADSYRRMIRWASNFVLTGEPDDVMAAERALAEGRSFLAFELFGTPAGFDIYLDSARGVIELGGESPASEAGHLVVETPRVANLYPGASQPMIETVVYRVGDDGRVEIARGTETLVVPADIPGAYHATVEIQPGHLEPYLGPLGFYAERRYTWVQSNAIYVR